MVVDRLRQLALLAGNFTWPAAAFSSRLILIHECLEPVSGVPETGVFEPLLSGGRRGRGGLSRWETVSAGTVIPLLMQLLPGLGGEGFLADVACGGGGGVVEHAGVDQQTPFHLKRLGTLVAHVATLTVVFPHVVTVSFKIFELFFTQFTSNIKKTTFSMNYIFVDLQEVFRGEDKTTEVTVVRLGGGVARGVVGDTGGGVIRGVVGGVGAAGLSLHHPASIHGHARGFPRLRRRPGQGDRAVWRSSAIADLQVFQRGNDLGGAGERVAEGGCGSAGIRTWIELRGQVGRQVVVESLQAADGGAADGTGKETCEGSGHTQL